MPSRVLSIFAPDRAWTRPSLRHANRRHLVTGIAWIAFTVGTVMDLAGAEPTVDFRKEILPILSNHCFRCHGPDAETRQADLRLDEREGATQELPSGATALVPGQPGESEIWRRITADDPETRMPPASSGMPLTAAQQEAIRQWIAAGAPYAKHWSFEAPHFTPPQPIDGDTTWAQDTLDRYVHAALEEIQWLPNKTAERATLLRRVTLDLIGLPPTPAELDAFVQDSRPDAYRRVVDRLLASPAYGERWAKVWLDLARFADSAGYAQDPPRNIWRYRDWVIDALNHNMPFDDFTIRQLAGDQLPGATNDDLLATAFHRNTLTNSEGGTDDEEFRTAAVVDRVNTTLEVWMGLTVGCAQCHSHKYDPISQVDYFRLYALLNNTADADRGDEQPLLTEFTAAEQRERSRLEQDLDRLRAERAQLASAPGTGGSSSSSTPASVNEAMKGLDEKIAAVEKSLSQITGTTTPILQELPTDKRRTTQLMLRGNFLAKGDVVEPAVLTQFAALPADCQNDRLGLARWLVAPDNPLTARVTVNRLWEQLFGIGLVETSEDFGLQGEKPSHPELLDYLAIELVRSGWDTKRLLRKLVLSATYCQSSVTDELKRTEDPQNRHLARGPSFRLPAEILRDQALAIAGLLSRKIHGPSVQPPRPALGLNSAFGGSTDWETSQGEDRYRRGLYTNWRRTTPYPSFTTFDAPSREVCTIRRIRTNTPLQALVTLNDPVFVEAAHALARRVLEAHPQANSRERLQAAWHLCVARQPNDGELERLQTLFEEAQRLINEQPDQARELIAPWNREGLDDDRQREQATWTVIANVLLNLDEVLSKK